MKKLIMCLLLTGCSVTSPNFNVEKQPMPDVYPPKHIKLEVCNWDIPRKSDETYVLNTTECQQYSKEEIKPTWFNNKCVKKSLDTESNLIIGLDQENYLCFVRNQQIIRSVLKSYDERLKLYNNNK